MSTATEPSGPAQGTREWREQRLGRITASRFSDVLTQPKDKTAEISKTARSYMMEVIAEKFTGQEKGTYTTKAMQWGIDNEGAARDVYESRTKLKVEEAGFLEHPSEPMVGGSPDGLVGEDGGIEIKCPFNTAVHLEYKLAGVLPKEHLAQVQGLLWVTGRTWWDFVSFDHRIRKEYVGDGAVKLALWRLRLYRDEEYIKNLERAVFAFRDKLLETICKLKEGE